MTTTMMRLRQHLSFPIYTTTIARISNRRRRTSTSKKPLLFLLVPLLLIPTIFFLLPPVTMSSSSSAPDAAATMMSAAAPPFEEPRTVVKKLLAESQPEGQGATVRRSIGRHELRNLDPFLMLDEFSVSKPAGFPDHPHRGFETVTYMLEGAFTHQDFAGHKGTIRAGDVQWMTAGRGIVHSEMPAGDGVQKGLQLWINVSSKDKMIEPRYQELQSKDISRVEKDGVEVRIIAGEAFGVRSPVYTRTPTMYMDFTMQPGSQLHQPIPGGLERLRVHHRRRGRVRAGESRPRHGAPLPSARPRRRAQRVEQVRRAAAVRAGGRAAAGRAGGAARAVRDEYARRDPAGHGGLLLRQERLREGQALEQLCLIIYMIPSSGSAAFLRN